VPFARFSFRLGAEVIFTAAGAKDLRQVVTDSSAVEELIESAVKRLTMFKTEFNIKPVVCFEGALSPPEAQGGIFLRCWGNRDIFDAQRKIGQQMHKALEKVGIFCIQCPGYASAQCGSLGERKEVALVVGMHYDIFQWKCPRVMYDLAEDGKGLLVELDSVMKDWGLHNQYDLTLAFTLFATLNQDENQPLQPKEAFTKAINKAKSGASGATAGRK